MFQYLRKNSTAFAAYIAVSCAVGSSAGLYIANVLHRTPGLSIFSEAYGASVPHPVTFCNICDNYTISRKDEALMIRCPGDPVETPWMTFQHCGKNPKATKVGNSLTITCN